MPKPMSSNNLALTTKIPYLSFVCVMTLPFSGFRGPRKQYLRKFDQAALSQAGDGLGARPRDTTVGEPVHWVDRGQVSRKHPNQLPLDVTGTSCGMGESLRACGPTWGGEGATTGSGIPTWDQTAGTSQRDGLRRLRKRNERGEGVGSVLDQHHGPGKSEWS